MSTTTNLIFFVARRKIHRSFLPSFKLFHCCFCGYIVAPKESIYGYSTTQLLFFFSAAVYFVQITSQSSPLEVPRKGLC